MEITNLSFNSTKATNTSVLVAGTPNQAIIKFEIAPEIETNKSFVKWTIVAGGTSGSCYWYSIDFSYGTGANWKTTYSKYTQLYTKQEQQVTAGATVATGSFYVDHNLDGTQQLGFLFEAYAYPDPNSSVMVIGSKNFIMRSALGSATLTTVPVGFDMPTIPRTSTVSCTTVEVGQKPTITINSPSATFTHTLRYQFGSLSGTIVSKTASRSYSSWTVPTSFLAEIEGAKYGEGTIYCDTYTGDSLNGTSSTTFRVNVPGTAGPTISPTFRDSNSTTIALTGDSSKIVQYFSNVAYTIGATATAGATITSQQINCAGKTATTATGTLYKVESNAFTITVTDSREFISSETFHLTMVPYIKLTAKLKLVSIDTNGTGSISINGNLFRGSFGAVENNPVISYRWKEDGGTWSDWTEVVYNVTNDSYYGEVQFQGLDYQKTYLYEAKAVDSLMTVEPEQLVVRCMPVFDWDDQDFQFNVPVTINGDLVVTGSVTSADDEEEAVKPVDYVVETGTSDIWTYRKWNSGAAECWGTIAPTSISVSTAWGSLYVADNAITRVYYPFEFIDVPVVSMTLYNTTGNCWAYTGTQGSALLTPAFGIARGTSGSVTTGAQITAIGRWK